MRVLRMRNDPNKRRQPRQTVDQPVVHGTLQSGDTFRGYTIRRQLDRGGMSIVYHATHPEHGEVALKFPANARMHKRFHREARILENQRHGGIVNLYEVNLRTNPPYLATEWLGEVSGYDYLVSDAPLHEKMRTLSPLCGAVGSMHTAGEIHRDLKGDNFMVHRGKAKLIDLGLAASELETKMSQTMKNAAMGSKPYMAPEVRAGSVRETLAKRVDVWGLGCLFHRAATGELPDVHFKGVIPEAVILSDRHLRKQSDRRFNALIAACLALNPLDRPPDANAAKVWLDACLAEANPKRVVPVPRHLRRRKTAWRAWLALLPAALLLAGGGFYAGSPAVRSWVNEQADRLGSDGAAFEKEERTTDIIDLPPPPARSSPSALDFNPASNGVLRVVATPPGARIYLRHVGEDLRQGGLHAAPEAGPLTLSVPQGEYELVVQAVRHEGVTQKVLVGPSPSSREVHLARRRATVIFQTTPGATIRLANPAENQRKTIRVPASGEAKEGGLLEGHWTWEISLADHETARGTIDSLEKLDPSQTRGPIRRMLQPMPGAVHLDTHREVTVWQSGRQLGTANQDIRLPAGTHTLELRRPGFVPASMRVEVPPNRTLVPRRLPDLQREPPPAQHLPKGFKPYEGAKPAPLNGLAAGSAVAQRDQIDTARRRNLPLEAECTVTGSRFRFVPAGVFQMGSTKGDGDEKPVHRVSLTRDFYLGTAEFTQAALAKVGEDNPSDFKGANLPVETISWNQVAELCNLLSQKAGLPEREYAYVREGDAWRFRGPQVKGYRMPLEAEWEYACRAGTTTATCFGDALSSRQANFDGDFPLGGADKGPDLRRTRDVGSYSPNAWGLHDMHGNVWEWCSDWYASDAYNRGAVTDPSGPASGAFRVDRGGSWFNYGGLCRSALRLRYPPDGRGRDLGFRLARTISP